HHGEGGILPRDGGILPRDGGNLPRWEGALRLGRGLRFLPERNPYGQRRHLPGRSGARSGARGRKQVPCHIYFRSRESRSFLEALPPRARRGPRRRRRVRRLPGGARAHEEGDKEDDMNSVTGPRAVVGTAQKNYPGVQARGQAMANSIQANIANFPSLPIAIAAFLALLTAFVVAQQAATETKAKGAAGIRNTKGTALWNAMELIQKYIQGLADQLSAEAGASL